MTDHVKGPWVVVPNDGAYVKQSGLATLRIEERSTPSEMVLAMVVTDCPRLRIQGKANANLIAAAPDLLAACEGFVALFRDFALIRDSDAPSQDDCYELYELASAAIAKAKTP